MEERGELRLTRVLTEEITGKASGTGSMASRYTVPIGLSRGTTNYERLAVHEVWEELDDKPASHKNPVMLNSTVMNPDVIRLENTTVEEVRDQYVGFLKRLITEAVGRAVRHETRDREERERAAAEKAERMNRIREAGDQIRFD